MKDDKYKAIVEAVWAVCKERERGSVVAWADIELIMGRHRGDEGGWTIINRVRKRLLRERSICTLAVDTVGLRLLTDREAAIEIPAMRQKKAYRQVNRCLAETSRIDDSKLSDHERRVLAMQRHNMRYQRLQIGRSRRELAKGVKPTEVNPIRKVYDL